MRKRNLAVFVAAISLVVSATSASAGGWETARVVGQGLAGPVVAPGGAAILRSQNSVAASLTMPDARAG